MPHRQLSNKPLVEAILEIRWRLDNKKPGLSHDPHYKLLLGRLFDRLSADYPEYEQLPTASFPEELVGYTVQHRLRVEADKWPLVQIGPGVVTLNSTADYTWDTFRPRAVALVGKLYESHPKLSEYGIESLVLRYIDAVEFDYLANDVFEFLHAMMKVEIGIPRRLFAQQRVEQRPQLFSWESSFSCSSPRGKVLLRFATGQKNGLPAVVWETTLESTGDDLPCLPDGFEKWVDDAHQVVNDWFFELIQGELERRFAGE